MFGERLKLARQAAGLSQKNLSQATNNGVTDYTIKQFERGNKLPGSKEVHQLAKVLNVTAQFLLSNRVHALEDLEFRKLANSTVQERAKVETLL